MTDSGRLEPFVAVTQPIAFAMPAKGNFRLKRSFTLPMINGCFALKKRSFGQRSSDGRF